jgi:CoA:oxalate CoA-transferase
VHQGALSHLRVVDLTHHIAGPYCTKLLADFGADVIKIERPGAGDPARASGPFAGGTPDPEKSGRFLYLNTNKRGMTLNLKAATGREILERLVRDADVLVENFRPGVLPGLGLDYETLAAINPRLVVTSISNFGQTGPYRDYRATEIVADAMGGWMYGLGVPEREPIKPPGVQAQLVAGIFGLLGTLSAVHARALTDRGQHVDVSIQEAVLWIQMNITTTYSYSGGIWKRHGGQSAMNHPQGLFECKDGIIGVNVLYYVEWDRFAEFVGHPEWLQDPRFATPVLRAQNREAMDEILKPWLRERTRQELFESAQRAKIPFALVNEPADLVASPQLQARGFWENVDHPVAGAVTMPGAPFKLSETPWTLRRPAPRLSEHTAEVLVGQLGYTDDAVLRLRERGVI